MKTTVVDISLKSVIKIVALLVGLIFVWQIRFILIGLFSAYIIMIGFAQFADWFQAKGLNKSLSAVLSYLILIFVLGILVFLIVPPLLIESKVFIAQFPKYITKLNSLYSSNYLFADEIGNLSGLITNQFGNIVSGSLKIVLNSFNALLGFIAVAVLSFYLLVEREIIKSNLFRLFPNLPKDRVTNLAHKIEDQVGYWLKGELVLMFVIFCLTFIGLTLLGVEYALPLALLAGLLEAVPIVGPILAAIPAIIITVAISPLAAIGVIILYILIQQLENNFLVPSIMKGAIGISPLLTILALLIGVNLFGIMGAVLAVPFAAVAQVIVLDLIEHQDFK